MLHLVDKDNNDRSAPKVNHQGVLLPASVPAHGTTSVNYVNPGTTQGTSSPLNSAFFQLVQSDNVSCALSGSAESIISFPHNLNYAPFILASINNTAVSNIANNVNMPLPTWLSANITGGTIDFTMYVSAMVDSENVYFYFINGAGTVITYVVTYYLYRQGAQVS